MTVDSSLDIVIAWHGLPHYGARLLNQTAASTNLAFRVIGTSSSVPQSEIEATLEQQVIWIDPARSIQWADLALKVPRLFIHTGWAYPAFNSLAKAVKRAGGRVVAIVDNNRKNTLRQLGGSLVFRAIHRSRLDAVWVPGQSGCQLMQLFGLAGENVYTGVYGADPTVFYVGPPLYQRLKQFLFVGQLIPRKAPDLLVRAFIRFRSHNPDWSLKIVGSGPLQPELARDGIQVVPFLPPESVAKHFRESRFLVLPSHEEHWGVVVHEAALSGCGLILSDAVGAAPDLVDRSNGFIFAKGDVDDLCRSLEAAASQTVVQLTRTLEGSVGLASRFGPRHFAQSLSQMIVDLG